MSERSLFFASEQLSCSLGVVPFWLLGMFCFVLNLVVSSVHKERSNSKKTPLYLQVGTPKNCPCFDMHRNGTTMAGMSIFLAESLPTPQELFLPPLEL